MIDWNLFKRSGLTQKETEKPQEQPDASKEESECAENNLVSSLQEVQILYICMFVCMRHSVF